jgi:hypothetical protein
MSALSLSPLCVSQSAPDAPFLQSPLAMTHSVYGTVQDFSQLLRHELLLLLPKPQGLLLLLPSQQMRPRAALLAHRLLLRAWLRVQVFSHLVVLLLLLLLARLELLLLLTRLELLLQHPAISALRA